MDAAKILEAVQNGTIDIKSAQDQLAKLKFSDKKQVTYKVSVKGAISFYNIRRMPITLYKEELDQILEVVNTSEFAQYVEQNKDQLSSKAKNKEE